MSIQTKAVLTSYDFSDALTLNFTLSSNYDENYYDGDVTIIYSKDERNPFSVKFEMNDDTTIESLDFKIIMSLLDKLKDMDLFNLDLNNLILNLEV